MHNTEQKTNTLINGIPLYNLNTPFCANNSQFYTYATQKRERIQLWNSASLIAADTHDIQNAHKEHHGNQVMLSKDGSKILVKTGSTNGIGLSRIQVINEHKQKADLTFTSFNLRNYAWDSEQNIIYALEILKEDVLALHTSTFPFQEKEKNTILSSTKKNTDFFSKNCIEIVDQGRKVLYHNGDYCCLFNLSNGKVSEPTQLDIGYTVDHNKNIRLILDDDKRYVTTLISDVNKVSVYDLHNNAKSTIKVKSELGLHEIVFLPQSSIFCVRRSQEDSLFFDAQTCQQVNPAHIQFAGHPEETCVTRTMSHGFYNNSFDLQPHIRVQDITLKQVELLARAKTYYEEKQVPLNVASLSDHQMVKAYVSLPAYIRRAENLILYDQ